ncbi:MAG: flagellar basal body rod modification protein, partial [Bacteroidetes bacterium]|nr:flagellar basal body rod modification protein [Bacteroidota bacterium]
MKKRILIFVIISAGLLLLTIWLLHRSNSEKKTSGTIHAGAMSIGETGKSRSRSEWEFNRLRDPVTNTIPADIRRGELEYARTLPKAEIKQKSTSWISRGPYNVGGRTRGAAIDVTDDNIIIAGGVSGGLWRSTDGGNTWSKMTQPDQLHNVTCIVQDTRPGKTNSWYYGTGESYGNSANEGFTAAFLGDGIYKSTDGGITWNWLESTHSGTPHVYDKWDYIWNIVVDPSCDTADIIYAACYKCLQRSTDGGETWTELIPFVNQGSWFTDVAVTTTGVVYTTFSADGTQKGIFRSGDGVNFNSILPGPSTDTIDTIPFPSAYYRIVIGINPANENEVYFLANTPSYGQHSDVFFGGEEWNSLWKYTYISGNGSGYGGTWQDLSYNLPANSPYPFENLYVQSSYDMAIRVKPDEPDVIFIGGTNIYRSTDGFTSSDNTKQIGGYKPGSVDTDWDIWP